MGRGAGQLRCVGRESLDMTVVSRALWKSSSSPLGSFGTRPHRNPLKCAELKTLTGQKVHHLHGLIRGTRIKPCIRPISTASGGSGPCGLNRPALLLGNASIYRSLRDISQGPSRISRSCLSLVCRGCALCDDAEGSIPARRSSFLHNSVNRSTCEPFELRRPLLAFRSAGQRRTASHRYQRIPCSSRKTV